MCHLCIRSEYSVTPQSVRAHYVSISSLFFLPKSFWVPAKERVGSYFGSQFLLMLGAECARVEPSRWGYCTIRKRFAPQLTFVVIFAGGNASGKPVSHQRIPLKSACLLAYFVSLCRASILNLARSRAMTRLRRVTTWSSSGKRPRVGRERDICLPMTPRYLGARGMYLRRRGAPGPYLGAMMIVCGGRYTGGSE